MNKNQSRIQTVTTPLALVAALLASNTALGDVTQGGDVVSGNIGYDASGWVTVDGGKHHSSTSGRIGYQSTGNGVLTVQGIGTRYTKSLHAIGYQGTGLVNVLSGATFSSGSSGGLQVGQLAGAQGTIRVIGVDSKFTSSTSIVVGNSGGAGTVFVEDGGLLSFTGNSHFVVTNGTTVISGGTIGPTQSFSTGSSLPGSQSLLTIQNGGNLEAGTRFSLFNGAATVDGLFSRLDCNQVLMASAGESLVAELFVSDGAIVSVDNTFEMTHLGIVNGLHDNCILDVKGDSSQVVIGGDFMCNTNADDSIRVFVFDNARLIVGQDFTIGNGDTGLAGKDAVVSVGGNMLMNPNPGYTNKPFINYTPTHHETPFVTLAGNLIFNNPGSKLNFLHNSELTLAPGDRFPVIAIGGTIIANGDALPRFANREEGDIVDTYNGIDLYITYQGGDGNDIELYTLEAEPCLADLTGDGALDFFDVSAFLTAFGNSDPIADFSGDGSFDFFDVSGFLSAFSAGCP